MSHNTSGVPWDWALDFRNVMVVVGPSQRPGTRNPRHFQRGFYDGKEFGIESTTGEMVNCRSLEDNSSIEVPAEYLAPVRPDDEGQVVIFLSGGDLKGQQRTTQYKSDNQWMMEQEPSDVVGLVMDEDCLARIWNTD